MEKEIVLKVILVKASRTKNGKSVVDYIYEDKDIKLPDYAKGMREGQVWEDTDTLFQSLSTDVFGQTLKGKFEYRSTYNGSLIKQLISAEDKDGKVIISSK